MLKKDQRLTRKEFQHVFKKGKFSRASNFIVKYAPKKDIARFGVSCGLKVSKKAVERNQIRRKIYDIITLEYEQMPAGDYIIIVLPGTFLQGDSVIADRLINELRAISRQPLHKKY